MFKGTTIDELLSIVERAEEHARTNEPVATEMKLDKDIAFLYVMPHQQAWYGVA